MHSSKAQRKSYEQAQEPQESLTVDIETASIPKQKNTPGEVLSPQDGSKTQS